MWKPTAILLLTTVLPLEALACQPSKACALQRARQLAVEHLAAEPQNFAQGGWQDMVRLIVMLERKAAPHLAPAIAELLTRTRNAGRYDQVLDEVAFEVALVMPERGLQIADQLENAAQRDDTYESLADLFADDGHPDLALRARMRMSPRARTALQALTLAGLQWSSGLTTAARATVTPFLHTEYRDEIWHFLADLTAAEGDYAAALALVENIADDGEHVAALAGISWRQIRQRQRTAALATLELRAEFIRKRPASAAAEQLLADLAAAGAVPKALTLLAEFDIEHGRGLKEIAEGQVRAGDLAGARTTLQRLLAAERQDSHAMYQLLYALLLTETNPVAVLNESTHLNQLEELAKQAAVELSRQGRRARAGQILQHAVARVRPSRPCHAVCEIIFMSHAPLSPCMVSDRDYQLCNLAAIQAELGFIAAAEATAAAIVAPAPRIKAWVEIAEAYLAKRQFAAARRTFDRSLQLALTSAPGKLDEVIRTYASSIRGNPQLRGGLAALTRAAPHTTRDDREAAQRALAGGHASAGNFVAAFEVIEKLMRSDRVGGYIEIFESAD